jgi:hypothetical protein
MRSRNQREGGKVKRYTAKIDWDYDSEDNMSACGIEFNEDKCGRFYSVEDVKAEILPLLKAYLNLITVLEGSFHTIPEHLDDLTKAIKELEA